MLDKLMDESGQDHGQVIQTQTTCNSTQVAETHVKLGQHWTKKNEIGKNDSFSRAKEIDPYLFGKLHPQIA
jgi:hypothetical protein